MLLAIFASATLLSAVQGNIIVYTQDSPHTIAEEFRDLPASFGPELPDDGLRGFLVAGEPRDGCSPLQRPPTDDNFTQKWIVILARFNCSFETKIRNAQAAGYDCAIVHNVNSSDLETMSAKNSEGIAIPSVFVSDVAGEILVYSDLYTSGFYVMINGDLPFNINTHLLLPFAIVVALCLLVMVIFMIVKCIKDRRRARRHRLPSRALKKIPTTKFSKGDPYDTCAICLDDYQEGERLRVLPCAHAYHALCIDPWLTKNRRVCPVCKRKVLASGERRDDSDSDTEPLRPDTVRTQGGGTFEPQTENPFIRAANYMARLRRARRRPAEDDHEGDGDEAGNLGDEEQAEDTRPLLSAVSERPRRTRGSRSRRNTAPPPLLTSTEHSINPPGAEVGEESPEEAGEGAGTGVGTGAGPGDHEGEIGVAALPATQTPTHIRL